jgi:hypothetical protein
VRRAALSLVSALLLILPACSSNSGGSSGPGYGYPPAGPGASTDTGGAAAPEGSADSGSATGGPSDPLPTPLVMSEVVVASGSGLQRLPGVAWGDEGFLVAWNEDGETGAVIRARWVSAAGQPAEPFTVSAEGISESAAPRVAWGDGRFQVTWVDPRGGVTQAQALLTRRVGKEGPVAEAFEVAGGATPMSPPAIAFGGGVFAFAWGGLVTKLTEPSAFAAVLNGAGSASPTPGAASALSDTGGPVSDVAIAFGQDAFLCAWVAHPYSGIDGAAVMVRRLSSSGQPEGNAIELANTSNPRPDGLDMAFGGGLFLVVYGWQSDEHVNPEKAVTGVYLGPLGGLLGRVDLEAEGKRRSWPALAFSKSAFTLAWAEAPELGSPTRVALASLESGATVGQTGRRSASIFVSEDGARAQRSPSITASREGKTVIVWEELDSGDVRTGNIQAAFGAP